jgi:hypothetical protein
LERFYFFLAIFSLPFSFALQRRFLKLEVALPEHFKSLKMKHKWLRSKEMIGERLVIGDGHFYPNLISLPLALRLVFF